MDNKSTPNKRAVVKALNSVFSREPITAIYTVIGYNNGDWLQVIDEDGATSGVSAIHLGGVRPPIGVQFKMTCIGCLITSAELIKEQADGQAENHD